MFIDDVIQDMKLINDGNAALVNGGTEVVKGGKINNNNPMSQGRADPGVLKARELPGLGEFYDCVVSHVTGPGEVWLQSHHSLKIYRTLHDQVLAFYAANRGGSIENPEPGKVNNKEVLGNSFFFRRYDRSCYGWR